MILIHHQGRTGRVDQEFPFPNKIPMYFARWKPTPNYPTHAETLMEAQRIWKDAFDLALSKVTWFDKKEEERLRFAIWDDDDLTPPMTKLETFKIVEDVPFTVDLPETVEQWQCNLDQTIWEDSFCDSVSREKFIANGFQYRTVLRFKEEQK